MRSHFVRAKTTDTYFQEVADQHTPTAKTRLEADLYEQHEACAMATRFYGQNGHTNGQWEIIEATPSERHSWRSRRGGQAGTAKQARARKRTAQRYAGRRRICRACGAKMERGADKHLCETCDV